MKKYPIQILQHLAASFGPSYKVGEYRFFFLTNVFQDLKSEGILANGILIRSKPTQIKFNDFLDDGVKLS